MSRPKLVVVSSEQPDQLKGGRKYRFELSRKRLTAYIFCSFFALCFMFVLGLLVGRGIALVNSDDFSARAEIMRFLGLDRQVGQPAAKAGDSWSDPRKMLESLNYYEDLTQKASTVPPPSARPALADSAAPAAGMEPPPKEVTREAKRTVSQPQPVPERAPAPEPEKPAKSPAPGAVSLPGEQYTLLVASLKDKDNAQRLFDQLRSKGYTPRLEALDLNGGGAWTRVLVGSFQSREAAIRFAAEFNKKENMEGLVVRESH
ncbi:MAG: SPOR domain-containing protein [Desulfobacteraceae bacterium]|nr:SPOR domain-containing protein [Desulfobacteraceae bacterium]